MSEMSAKPTWLPALKGPQRRIVQLLGNQLTCLASPGQAMSVLVQAERCRVRASGSTCAVGRRLCSSGGRRWASGTRAAGSRCCVLSRGVARLDEGDHDGEPVERVRSKSVMEDRYSRMMLQPKIPGRRISCFC